MTPYRTWLERVRPMIPGTCAFIMLNPSMATDTVDDMTVRRCMGFRDRFQLGRLVVVNLFTYRTKDPNRLAKAADPVGPYAQTMIETVLRDSWSGDMRTPGDLVICAWGASNPKWPEEFRALRAKRIRDVLTSAHDLRRPLHALGLTKNGDPRHPSRIAADTPLIPFEFEMAQ